jgi:hypothetical protein
MSPHADTELLSAYLDGEVPTSERAGLEEHLASCPQCSARKSALEGVIRSVGGLPPVTTTEAEHLAIRRAVLEGAGARGPDWALKRARAWKIFAATAAVAAVVAGILSFVLVKASGPKVTSTASAPAPSAPPALPNLGNDAEVRSYARTQPGVSTFLGQGHATAGAAAPQAPLPAPTAAPPAFAQLNPSAPKSDRANASGTAPQAGPPTLGSCTRDAVLAGGALLGATPVTYQATPAWVIAYGAPSGSAGTLDRVVVEVRSQSSCSVLDQATLVP